MSDGGAYGSDDKWDYSAIRDDSQSIKQGVSRTIRLPFDVDEAILEIVEGRHNPGFKNVSQFVRHAIMNNLAYWQAEMEGAGEFQRKAGLALLREQTQAEQRARDHAEAIVNMFQEAFRRADREDDAEEIGRLLDRAKQAVDSIRFRKLQERLGDMIREYQK